ncbi:hypothetical protein FRC00_012557 [Tulasnella sp. 408]|nr:hypothetical protein FRC00_012557 [Tulasnella sp. 408]
MVLPIVYRLRNVKGGIYLDEREDSIGGWPNDPQSESQKWILEPGQDGWHLKNLKSKLYASSISHQGDNSLKASSIKDIWWFYNRGTGYALCLKASDPLKAIDLSKGGSKPGTHVNVLPYDTSAEQQLWELEEVKDPQLSGQYKGPIPPGTYRIHNILTNTALDLAGGKKDEGMKVHSWSAHGGPNQNWIFESGTDGYRIKNGTSGTYLRSEELAPGSELTCRSASVEWTVTQADKGFMIHTVGESEADLVIELDGGDNGVRPRVRANKDTDNQKWRIEFVV